MKLCEQEVDLEYREAGDAEVIPDSNEISRMKTYFSLLHMQP